MNKYDCIIGLEIHTELKTASKMFCACANQPMAAEANRYTCPICLGHPGTLPLLNAQALRHALLLACALEANINRFSKFDRKNYFYPDLPKGYQISQYDLPLAEGGYLHIGPNREIAITRLHLEEDTGKSSHDEQASLLDFNRAGIPLIELVTEPVIRSAEEAKRFCQRFQQTLRALDISDADMEKGLMRCEANISLQRPGSWKYEDGRILPSGEEPLNHKVEVKNINSFKAVEKAILYEIERQSRLLDEGDRIVAETRGWSDSQNLTISQRRKETQADYRYFPEPDLPPLVIDEALIAEARSQVAELPEAKHQRLSQEYGLSELEAEFLLGNRSAADYFEQTVSELRAWIEAEGDDWQRQNRKLAKAVYGTLTGDLLRLAGEQETVDYRQRVSPENLAELVKLIYKGQLNSAAGRQVLTEMFATGGDPTDIMQRLGLEQVDDRAALAALVAQVLADNPQQAKEFTQGKETLAKFFVGKVMAASGGKANPQIVQEILQTHINL